MQFWRLYKFQVEQDGDGGCEFVKNRFAFKEYVILRLSDMRKATHMDLVVRNPKLDRELVF